MFIIKVRMNIIYLFRPRLYEAIFDEEYRLSIRLLQVFEVPVQD
jgi:hypothetical protein